MPNLVHGQDPSGALRPIQVDDNGNLSVDIVSGVSVSTSISGTMEVRQVSGATDSVNVTQLAGTDVAVNSGVANAGTLRTVHVADVATSTDVRQIAGTDVAVNSGVANNGTLRVVHVTDVATSVSVTGVPQVMGDIASDSPDTSSNPVKVGGQARTTNPTAVADADRVNFTADDLGRQVITPYQVRDLIQTAYLALSTGTETAVQAGVASTLLDLVQIVCANQSDAAVDIDFRFGTGGTVSLSLTIPADSTAGFIPAVPIPMPEVAQAFTADMADITGTTVNITATFIKNV